MTGSPGFAASIVALSLVTLLLSALVLLRFRGDRQRCYLYWGAGLFLVFVTLVQEAVLYVGVWSQLLIQSYLILVAVLVGILSLGSAELSLRGLSKYLWFGYMVVTSVTLAVVGFLETVPSSVVSGGVVSGSPPTSVLVVSSLVTFPAAAMLIASSLYGAVRTKRYQLLYITIGTIVISIAGSLYLVSVPVTLYYAEFVGVALLFLGFVQVPRLAGRVGRPTPA